MNIIFKDVVPTFIHNTIMKQSFNDGQPSAYYIMPIEGYVMHDKHYDAPEINPETFEETGNIILGYRTNCASLSIDYDFNKNPRELYAIPLKDANLEQYVIKIMNDDEKLFEEEF